MTNKAKYPSNRDGMWQYMRDNRSFYIKACAHHVDVHTTSVTAYVKALHKAGYLMASRNTKDVMLVEYTLVKDPGNLRPELTAKGLPVPPSGTQRMWKAMKATKSFSVKDLSMISSVHNVSARSYCEFLYEAGYLRIVDGIEDKAITVFTFNKTKDTGHYAPQVRRSKYVYDRNINQIVWTEMFKEAA